MIQVVDDRPAPDTAPDGPSPLLSGNRAPERRREAEDPGKPVDFFPSQPPQVSWPRIFPGL